MTSITAAATARKQYELDILLSKHDDYGPRNITDTPGGPIVGLAVRLHDKMARLTHLLYAGYGPRHEGLLDTALDIANYGTILALVLEGEWPGADEKIGYDDGRDVFAVDDLMAAASAEAAAIADRALARLLDDVAGTAAASICDDVADDVVGGSSRSGYLPGTWVRYTGPSGVRPVNGDGDEIGLRVHVDSPSSRVGMIVDGPDNIDGFVDVYSVDFITDDGAGSIRQDGAAGACLEPWTPAVGERVEIIDDLDDPDSWQSDDCPVGAVGTVDRIADGGDLYRYAVVTDGDLGGAWQCAAEELAPTA